MDRLVFEKKGGLVEVRKESEVLAEALNLRKVGAGAAMAGAIGLHLLAKFAETITPDARKGDFSNRTKGLFGTVMNTIAEMDPDKKKKNEKMLALKQRMDMFKELETGKVTADTILKVLGPVGELSENEEKWLKSSDVYHRLVDTYKKQLQSMAADPKKHSGKINAAYDAMKGRTKK